MYVVDQPDLVHGLPYWRRSLQDYVVNHIVGNVHLGCTSVRILDLGCGLGYTLARLSGLLPIGAEIVGVDVSNDAVERARRLLKETSGNSNVQVRCSDAKSTPFRDGYFDFLIANLSFSVFKSPGEVASEAARILKPGGTIVATEVRKNSLLGRVGELFDALTGRLYYKLYSPSGLVNLFIPLGMRVKTVSRIPLTARLLGRCLRIPSMLSPVFLVELYKPLFLHEGKRVN